MNEKWAYEEMDSESRAAAVTAETVEVAATGVRAEGADLLTRRTRQRAGRRPLDSETPGDDL